VVTHVSQRYLVIMEELSRDDAEAVYCEMLDWGCQGPQGLYES
jgi:hypothetical protein